MEEIPMSGVTGGGRDHGLWHGMRHWQSPKGASQQLNPNAYGTAPAFHPSGTPLVASAKVVVGVPVHRALPAQR